MTPVSMNRIGLPHLALILASRSLIGFIAATISAMGVASVCLAASSSGRPSAKGTG